MTEWKEQPEGDFKCWIDKEEKLANIIQLKESVFMVMMPKMFKFGPFETLDEAKQAVDDNAKILDELVEDLLAASRDE